MTMIKKAKQVIAILGLLFLGTTLVQADTVVNPVSCTADYSQTAGYECSKTYDRNPSTTWYTFTNGTHSVTLDYATPVQIGSTYSYLGGGINPLLNGKKLTIDASNDATTWTQINVYTANGDTAYVPQFFTNYTPYRYWRFTVEAPSSGAGINEIYTYIPDIATSTSATSTGAIDQETKDMIISTLIVILFMFGGYVGLNIMT